MGVRPFYYHYVPGQCFAFASEVNALHALDLVPRALDAEMVALYLAAPGAYMREPRRTTLKGIHKLPRSARLVLGEQASPREEVYWEPSAEPLQLKDNAAYAEAFQSRLFQGGSQQAACLNTGGVDAQWRARFVVDHVPCAEPGLYVFPSIAHVLRHLSGPRGGESRGDRRASPTLRSVASLRRHRTALHSGRQAWGPFYEFDTIVKAFGQLYFGGNAFFHWRAAQLCSRHGNRVLLDGTDGDSVVSHGTDFARGPWYDKVAWDTFEKATSKKR